MAYGLGHQLAASSQQLLATPGSIGALGTWLFLSDEDVRRKLGLYEVLFSNLKCLLPILPRRHFPADYPDVRAMSSLEGMLLDLRRLSFLVYRRKAEKEEKAHTGKLVIVTKKGVPK